MFSEVGVGVSVSVSFCLFYTTNGWEVKSESGGGQARLLKSST